MVLQIMSVTSQSHKLAPHTNFVVVQELYAIFLPVCNQVLLKVVLRLYITECMLACCLLFGDIVKIRLICVLHFTVSCWSAVGFMVFNWL